VGWKGSREAGKLTGGATTDRETASSVRTLVHGLHHRR
jgi:hypothetical protein